MIPLYAGLFVAWNTVEGVLQRFLEKLRDEFDKEREISALTPVKSPHVTTWYFGGSWARLNALGGPALLDRVAKQEGTETSFQIHHLIFDTMGAIVADVRSLDGLLEREPAGTPHLTLMTGALRPRDAGEVVLVAGQMGLLDEQDIGPGEMFHVPEAHLGGVQTSLLIFRMPEPLALRAVYRTVSVEEPADEAPSLPAPARETGGPTGLPPPNRDRPTSDLSPAMTYSRDELVRQRPRFTTIVPEFASLKTREWGRHMKKKRYAAESSPTSGLPAASPREEGEATPALIASEPPPLPPGLPAPPRPAGSPRELH